MFFYNSDTLGVFNQIYAYYIVISQVAVLGIHLSVLKYTSNANNDEEQYILATGIMCVLIISIIIVGVMYLICKLFIQDKQFYVGLLTILPAFPFFSINKVLLNYLNGLSRMKEYAIFQTLRIISIICSIIIIFILGLGQNYICLSLTLGEIFLFIIIASYFIKNRLVKWKISTYWIKKHMNFGLKAFPSNVVVDLNTKIDIICLGFFINNNSIIGIYSFATLFTEGFYQIFVVIRRSINPYITKMFMENDFDMRILGKKNKKVIYMGGALANSLIIIGVYVMCKLFKAEYLQAILPLTIISIGITFNSYYIVLGNSLSQIGRPEIESLLNCITLGTNFLLNMLLINKFGMTGAAIATAISYFVYKIILKYNIRKYISSLLV